MAQKIDLLPDDVRKKLLMNTAALDVYNQQIRAISEKMAELLAEFRESLHNE